MAGSAPYRLALAAMSVLAAGLAMVFFYAPLDADQGFIQKIFYLHVPLSIVALVGFVCGGVFGVLYLRTRRRKWDLYSYVTIHTGMIFGIAVLVTGAIWAKAAWGRWWVWGEPTLVSFLIVFLLYATYQPLRLSIDDPERQARFGAIFATVAGVFVPVNFIAVRMAESLVHPRVLTATGGSMPGQMRITFLVMIAGIALLFASLVRFEATAKELRRRLRGLDRRKSEAAEEDLPAPFVVSAATEPRSAAAADQDHGNECIETDRRRADHAGAAT